MGMWRMISNTAVYTISVVLASLFALKSISGLLFKLLKLPIILLTTQNACVVIRCEFNDLDRASLFEFLFCYFLLDKKGPFLLFDALLQELLACFFTLRALVIHHLLKLFLLVLKL